MTAYLTWTEVKLLAREPLVLILSLLFPIVLAYAGFDLAAPASIGGVLAAFAVGVLAFAGIGALLGAVMPGARAAQGLGLLLFLGTIAWGRDVRRRRQCRSQRLHPIIHAALDQGINFVDTADMYSAGESEEIVGKALRVRRVDVVLATKVHFQMGEGHNRSGNSRRWILNPVHESLRRLDTDWIDLYQVHRPDHTTDIEETLSVLGDLVRDGRSAHSGVRRFRPPTSSRHTTSPRIRRNGVSGRR